MSRSCYRLAEFYVQHGELDQVVTHLESVWRIAEERLEHGLSPVVVKGMELLAAIHLSRGRSREADQAWRRLIAIADEHPLAANSELRQAFGRLAERCRAAGLTVEADELGAYAEQLGR